MAQSGAGAEITALAESLQAYACATRQALGKDLTSIGQITSETITTAQCDRTLEKCIKGLDDDWYSSVIRTANQIFKDFRIPKGNTYMFYRGKGPVGDIYKEFGRFRKESGIKGDDKWNPADIWMAKRTFKLEKDWPTLKEYNTYIYEQYKKKNLVGISLKKLAPKGKATPKIYNDGKPPAAKFLGFKLGENMGDSKDIYIQYEAEHKQGEIQLRNFSSRPVTSSWQGEIKGKTAAGGKIGGGVLTSLAQDAKVQVNKPSDFNSHIQKPSDKVLQNFAKMFKKLSGTKKSIADLALEATALQKKDKTWWMSKYLGIEYCYILQESGKVNEVTRWIYGYGSSSTKNSSIFIKYS